MLVIRGCSYCKGEDRAVVEFGDVGIDRTICRECLETLLAVFKHPNQHTKKELA